MTHGLEKRSNRKRYAGWVLIDPRVLSLRWKEIPLSINLKSSFQYRLVNTNHISNKNIYISKPLSFHDYLNANVTKVSMLISFTSSTNRKRRRVTRGCTCTKRLHSQCMNIKHYAFLCNLQGPSSLIILSFLL